MTAWFQANFALQSRPRGFHLVTSEVVSCLDNIDRLDIGLLHLFIQHTSASLTINENADPDVRVDMETAANLICPENMPFIHTCEGPDDMPAHVKASFFGAGLTIPISSQSRRQPAGCGDLLRTNKKLIWEVSHDANHRCLQRRPRTTALVFVLQFPVLPLSGRIPKFDQPFSLGTTADDFV